MMQFTNHNTERSNVKFPAFCIKKTLTALKVVRSTPKQLIRGVYGRFHILLEGESSDLDTQVRCVFDWVYESRDP